MKDEDLEILQLKYNTAIAVKEWDRAKEYFIKIKQLKGELE